MDKLRLGKLLEFVIYRKEVYARKEKIREDRAPGSRIR